MARKMEPTKTGTTTTKTPGLIIIWIAAVETIPTQMPYSGFWSPVATPAMSRNWRRTSTTTFWAVMPTASIAKPAKRKTVVAPSRPPTNISGATASMTTRLPMLNCSTMSKNARKRRKHASPAELTAKPFVNALVVFPAASNLSMICRALAGQPSLISTMPAALSVIGPKTSMARTYVRVESMPIVATAVPKRPAGILDSYSGGPLSSRSMWTSSPEDIPRR
mmetsp:Transcript_115449/g.326298  ORF Transcript_115449/g.326298 Transcript_115449/m.326298 type:complete len:222 (+) Transcript_115449:366-1031(+)